MHGFSATPLIAHKYFLRVAHVFLWGFKLHPTTESLIFKPVKFVVGLMKFDRKFREACLQFCIFCQQISNSLLCYFLLSLGQVPLFNYLKNIGFKIIPNTTKFLFCEIIIFLCCPELLHIDLSEAPFFQCHYLYHLPCGSFHSIELNFCC